MTRLLALLLGTECRSQKTKTDKEKRERERECVIRRNEKRDIVKKGVENDKR